MLLFYTIVIYISWQGTLADENDGITENPPCQEVGPLCSQDCRDILYCPEIGISPMRMLTCPDELSCSNSTGTPHCDSLMCKGLKPKCSSLGALPSHEICTTYYICGLIGDPDPLQVDCPHGQVFDTETLDCSSNTTCREPTKCHSVGEQGFIDTDKQKFCYYCNEKLTPFIYHC